MDPEHQVNDTGKAEKKKKNDVKRLLHQPVQWMIQYIKQIHICPLKMKPEVKYIGQVQHEGKAVCQNKERNDDPCQGQNKPC